MSAELKAFCARSPDLKSALIEHFKAEQAHVLQRAVTAQTEQDLLRVQGAAQELASQLNKVAKW